MRTYYSITNPARFRLLAPVTVLIVALYAAGTGLFRVPLASCEIDKTQSVIPYDQIMQIWQNLFGQQIESGRLFSILLSVITLALLYKLVSAIYNQRRAVWTVCLAAVIPSMALILTWNTAYGWMAFLTVATALCTWYAVQQPKAIFLFYVTGVLLLLSGLWAVFLTDLLFLCISNRKSRFYALPGFLLIVGWFILARPIPAGRESILDLFQPVHTIFLIAWVLGLVSLLPLVLNRSSSTNDFKTPLWIMLGLVIPVLVWLLIPFDSALLLISIMVFALIAFGYAIAVLSGRAQVAMAGLLLFGIVMQIGPDRDLTILHSIQSLKADQTAVAISMPSRCLQNNDLASQLYEARMLPIYLQREDSTWLEITADRTPAHIDQLPAAGQYEWVIQPSSSHQVSKPENGLLVLQQDYPQVQTTLYYTGQHEAVTADHDVFYQVGELALLKFEVHPGVQVHPGDMLIFNSWWAMKTTTQDDYILTVDLDDKSGQAITFASGSIADSFTNNWAFNQVYYDQRALVIPEATAPGQYNLIMTLHGTFNMSNVHFKHADGGDVGDFGYLTTITVLPPG